MPQRARDYKTEYTPYPEPKSSRSGCKVSWNTYETEAEAKVCAEAAKHNARIKEAEGFDFGYQCPGFIRKVDDGYEVTLP